MWRLRNRSVLGVVRRQATWWAWGAIALVLLLGLDRILAHPDQSSAAPQGAVVISEFGAAGSGPTDEDGERADWIELHNRSVRPVNLNGWSLTDDPTQPDKWTFDNVTIAPGQYLLIFASNKDRDELDDEQPFLHTNFRLNSDGGHLALYPTTSRRYVDGSVYDYPAQLPTLSYGFVPMADGSWAARYMASPTPGAANDTSVTWAAILPPVRFSVPHGFFSAPVEVALTSPTPDATIRYTLDGSTPTADNGTPYTSPIVIDQTTPLRAVAFLPDHSPSPVATQSYIFLDDVINQPDDPAGWPQTWGVYSINRGPYVAGAPVEADYAMDARITYNPQYRDLLADGLVAIPSLSLVTDMANLDIYATPQARGRESERPVSVEWIDPTGAQPGFQVNAGIRIQGNAGRLEYMPKHSFRLFFRQQYGAAKLNYPLFPASYVTEFETLVLRGGVNYGFAGDIQDPTLGWQIDHRGNTTYLRDEWARTSQLAMSGVGARGRFVHLYINGLYWGLYNMVERPDSAFAASYLGGTEEDWASMNHGGSIYGNPNRFTMLAELGDSGGLDDPAKWATFLEFFNPVQFADYVILNWYAGNNDWVTTNWYAAVQNPAGRNYFFVWDAEAIWDSDPNIRLGEDAREGAPFVNVIKAAFLGAWANSDFRMIFADRLYHHLYNDGALTDAAAMTRWQELQQTIDTAIVAESARWGDARYDEPITREDWLGANDRVLGRMAGNSERFMALVRDAGYYPAIDPPAMSPRGADFAQAITVTLAAPAGIIYYTTDGSDPRLSGSDGASDGASGAPSPTAQRYNGTPITLTTTGSLRARLWLDGQWSALQVGEFRATNEQPRLTISEIMYNPYLDEEMEFLELKNVGNTAADLSGAYFDGIDFRFGEGTTLAAGEHLLLIRELKKFRRRYGDEIEIHGQYAGKLSDKGETITLYTPRGEVWLQATYNDARGWPLSADGAGDALEVIDPLGDLSDSYNWRASATLYGTPGADAASPAVVQVP